MFESLRDRLLSVQQDLTSGLKTLGDKSREVKISKQRNVQCLPEFSAGLDLLSRYEDVWAALHRGTKECAKMGELVDSEVVMLSAHWEKKRSSLLDLQEQLQQVPVFLADLESTTATLVQLEANFKEMENHLLNLEDLCGQCELERYKHIQALHLENYKKTKRKELEIFKEPIGSMSSMEVNVDMLEQMDLVDMSDQEALDVFLNSGGEDSTMPSPMTGPDSTTCQNEISLQVPPQSAWREKWSSPTGCPDSTSQDASEGESPVIQSDEEDVQVDTALVADSAEARGPSDPSDESDSQTG
ncbi:dysbindin isoform X3 [Paroedura picta]|uniref:dysbindin isoform X3 n=1 Tax=Paroedura picta TaxID=143630 RepID=UPI00405747E8